MTKYKKIAEDLEQRIIDGEYGPGDALPSELKLSDIYDVNRMTLRRALNVLEDSDLIVRHRGRGTFVKVPEQRRLSGKLVYIGDTESHFYRDLYLNVCRKAQLDGLEAVSYSVSQEKGEKLSQSHQFEKLLEDAMGVVCGTKVWDDIHGIVPEDIPVVRLSRSYPESPIAESERGGYIVSGDALRASVYATQHLIDRGHRRIGFLDVKDMEGGPHSLGQIHPGRSEYQGYQLALRQADIEDECIIPFPRDDFQEGGQEAIRTFIDEVEDMPTAFVCNGDFRASPFIEVMRDNYRKAPEHFSIVGIGNTPWCDMVTPKLTSVSFREEEMARLAVMLCQREQIQSPTVLQVRPTLVERKSVGIPPR